MTTILLENLWRRLAKPRPTAGSGPIASEPDPEPDFQDNVLARLGLLEATQRIADRLRAFLGSSRRHVEEDDGSQLPPTSVQIRAAGALPRGCPACEDVGSRALERIQPLALIRPFRKGRRSPLATWRRLPDPGRLARVPTASA